MLGCLGAISLLLLPKAVLGVCKQLVDILIDAHVSSNYFWRTADVDVEIAASKALLSLYLEMQQYHDTVQGLEWLPDAST